MFCQNCGNEINEKYAVCPNCGFVKPREGESLQNGQNYKGSANCRKSQGSSNYSNNNKQSSDTYAVKPTEEHFCIMCGKKVGEGYKLCPSCSEKAVLTKQKSSLVPAVIIASIVSLVIILASATYILYDKGMIFADNTSDDTEEVVNNEKDKEKEDGEEPENEEKNDNSSEKDEDIEEKSETGDKETDSGESGGSDTKKESVYEVYSTYQPISWETAKNIAKESGGYLACVNSEEEFRKICAIADEAGLVVFWIGAKRTGFSWNYVDCLDGSRYLPYTKWLKNEPSLSYDGVEERYLMALKSSGEWYFNDAPNDISSDYSQEKYRNKISFIIEKEVI